MIGAEYEKGVIALACWRAGHKDGAVGMAAVACVIRNRCRDEQFMDSAYLNAISLPEMGCGHEGHDLPQLYPDSREPQFELFMQMIDSVLYGFARDATDGALYYSSGPSEFTENRTRVSTIGKMTFYL